MDAVDLEGNWQEKILTAEHAEIAEKTNSGEQQSAFLKPVFLLILFLIREDPRESVARTLSA